MSASFVIKEHVIETQHIREYSRATAHSQEEALNLAVKQYIPKDNPSPQPGDITVIAAHANGFVKVKSYSPNTCDHSADISAQELYEPLWEDLLVESRKQGFKIRSIWIADIASQGQSGVLNETKLGNDRTFATEHTIQPLKPETNLSDHFRLACWFDDARDLLHMTNAFRSEMPRPIIGIGHSFGGNVLINLSLMHPRLLSGLVLVDPVLSVFSPPGRWDGIYFMKASSIRRDLWPSREAAVDAIARNKAFSSWDPRCLALLGEHALRNTPTSLYPDAPSGSVTLKTTKHREVANYYRPTYQRLDPSTGQRTFDKSLLPDAEPEDIDADSVYPFYRPEGNLTLSRLPSIRPPVLWVFGETSGVCIDEWRHDYVTKTGTGVGGNGGERTGRVKAFTVKGCGHLVAFEAPMDIARQAAAFVPPLVQEWREEERDYRLWADGDDSKKQRLDKGWLASLAAANVQKKAKL